MAKKKTDRGTALTRSKLLSSFRSLRKYFVILIEHTRALKNDFISDPFYASYRKRLSDNFNEHERGIQIEIRSLDLIIQDVLNKPEHVSNEDLIKYGKKLAAISDSLIIHTKESKDFFDEIDIVSEELLLDYVENDNDICLENDYIQENDYGSDNDKDLFS